MKLGNRVVLIALTLTALFSVGRILTKTKSGIDFFLSYLVSRSLSLAGGGPLCGRAGEADPRFTYSLLGWICRHGFYLSD